MVTQLEFKDIRDRLFLINFMYDVGIKSGISIDFERVWNWGRPPLPITIHVS